MISRNYRRSSNHGFSLIEIVTVIVVISILATITIVYYSSTRARADDTRRLSDMKTIEKALAAYLIKKGEYPPNVLASNCISGWSNSNQLDDNFLVNLKPYLDGKDVPVDPINTSQSYYRYFRYNAGYAGCDITKGNFYILQAISTTAKKDGSPLVEASPSFVCPNRTWPLETEGSVVYSSGKFEIP